MDMPVNRNRLPERPVKGLQFAIARFRPRRAPKTLGAGVHERQRAASLNAWQSAQPGEPLVSQRVARGPRPTVPPTTEFCLSRARRKAPRVAREFFDIYPRTDPDSTGGLPAYIERRTDESGCTRFDAPLMIRLYRGWLSFRPSHPDDYATDAQGAIDSLTTELHAATCPCGW